MGILKRKKHGKITPEYLIDLTLRDFIPPGLTDPEEIKIAKAYGVYKWTAFHESNSKRIKSSEIKT
jgi:hypothetical protein